MTYNYNVKISGFYGPYDQVIGALLARLREMEDKWNADSSVELSFKATDPDFKQHSQDNG